MRCTQPLALIRDVAGSERNNELARFVAEQWKQQGLEDVTIHRYDVLNTAPREVSLVWRRRSSTPTAAIPRTTPTCARRGSTCGARSSSSATRTPFARGKVFPDGPWGPESHIQRGAITYDFIVPGDPLTPGWPSLPGAPRVRLEEARSLPRIAALPLSWKDAKPLLEEATEKGRLDLSGLRSRIDELESAGERLNEAARRALDTGALTPEAAHRVNRGILEVERNWLDPEGLPGRPWFRHTLYAARFTYAHLELPGVTEAAEEGDWDRAVRQAAVLERAVARNAALVDELARALPGPESAAGR